MPDPINDTIAALTAAGATDDEITQIVKEKFGQPGGPNSLLARANATPLKEPTTYQEGSDKSWQDSLSPSGLMSTLTGFVGGAATGAAKTLNPSNFIHGVTPEEQQMHDEATGKRAPSTDYGMSNVRAIGDQFRTPEGIGELYGAGATSAALPGVLQKVPKTPVGRILDTGWAGTKAGILNAPFVGKPLRMAKEAMQERWSSGGSPNARGGTTPPRTPTPTEPPPPSGATPETPPPTEPPSSIHQQLVGSLVERGGSAQPEWITPAPHVPFERGPSMADIATADARAAWGKKNTGIPKADVEAATPVAEATQPRNFPEARGGEIRAKMADMTEAEAHLYRAQAKPGPVLLVIDKVMKERGWD